MVRNEKHRSGKEDVITITLDLKPEIEKGLLAQARSVSLSDYVQEIMARGAHVTPDHSPGAPARI